MKGIKKLFFVFTVALIALIITPNTIMGVSAGAEYDCDDDECVNHSHSDILLEILAEIAPILEEVDIDFLDEYEYFTEEVFVLVSTKEYDDQLYITSIEIIDAEQIEEIVICEETEMLFVVPSNTIVCCFDMSISTRTEWRKINGTLLMVTIRYCVNCGATWSNVPLER